MPEWNQHPRVTLETAGHSPSQQAALTALLDPCPQAGIERFGGWSLRLLHADLIVLSTDRRVGPETLDMLRSYSSIKGQHW